MAFKILKTLSIMEKIAIVIPDHSMVSINARNKATFLKIVTPFG